MIFLAKKHIFWLVFTILVIKAIQRDMKTRSKCPQCDGILQDKTYMPFCCARCQKIDLGKWFLEDYKVAGPSLEEAELDNLAQEDEHDTIH